jgi:tetraacyldisaccharide-1-P 4'-kinase
MIDFAGKVLAFCGIARPELFFQSLSLHGADLATLTFGDHHAYTQGDIERIRAAAEGKDLIITTEKDLARFDPARLDGRWHALRVTMVIEGLQTMLEEIEQRAQERRVSR